MKPDSRTQAIVQELARLRGARHVRYECVAWTLSEGCRFVIMLSPGQPPIGGIALPRVSEEVSRHLHALGLPQPRDHPEAQFAGWNFTPSIFLPFEHLVGKIDGGATVEQTVDYILRAEKLAREEAGSIGIALDFAGSVMPFAQTPPYLLPVGYYMLGRVTEAEQFIALCEEHFRGGPLSDLYARFVAQVRRSSQEPSQTT